MVLNPMKETFKVKVPLFNLNEKFPSKSDEIPWFVSLTRTVAPVKIF
jgi:hypothetical protein